MHVYVVDDCHDTHKKDSKKQQKINLHLKNITSQCMQQLSLLRYDLIGRLHLDLFMKKIKQTFESKM